MAAKRAGAKSTGKRANGQGDTITILFDIHDRTERRALQMSKLLASKSGRRKDMIVTLLAALYDHFEATGEVLTPAELGARLTGGQPSSAQPIGFTQAVNRQSVLSSEMPKMQPRGQAVTIEAARTTAADIGRNFTASAGSAFFD